MKEKSPKKKKGIIIGYIVLVLIILGLAGYILVDKGVIKLDSKKEVKEEVKKEEVKKDEPVELSIKDKLVERQMYKVITNFGFGTIDYFKNDSFSAKDLTNEQKFALAINQIDNLPMGCKMAKNECATDKNGNEIYESVTVTKNEMDKIMRSLFGPDYSYDSTAGLKNAASYFPVSVTYNSSKENYVFKAIPFGKTAFEDVGRLQFSRSIESAFKTSDKLTVNCKVWRSIFQMEESKTSDDFISYYNLYTANGKTFIKKVDNDEDVDNLEEADTYKYTFDYDEENKDYYFSSIELVK